MFVLWGVPVPPHSRPPNIPWGANRVWVYSGMSFPSWALPVTSHPRVPMPLSPHPTGRNSSLDPSGGAESHPQVPPRLHPPRWIPAPSPISTPGTGILRPVPAPAASGCSWRSLREQGMGWAAPGRAGGLFLPPSRRSRYLRWVRGRPGCRPGGTGWSWGAGSAPGTGTGSGGGTGAVSPGAAPGGSREGYPGGGAVPGHTCWSGRAWWTFP